MTPPPAERYLHGTQGLTGMVEKTARGVGTLQGESQQSLSLLQSSVLSLSLTEATVSCSVSQMFLREPALDIQLNFDVFCLEMEV